MHPCVRYNKLQDEAVEDLASNGPASSVLDKPGSNASGNNNQKKLAGWWSDLTKWMQPSSPGPGVESRSDQTSSSPTGAQTPRHQAAGLDAAGTHGGTRSGLEVLEKASLSAEVAAIRARDVGMPLDSGGNTASFVGRIPLEVGATIAVVGSSNSFTSTLLP